MKRRVKDSAEPNTQRVILKHFGLDDVTDFGGSGSFGAKTRDVNALRARTLWLHGSVRLLDDLIEVTRDAVEGLANDYDLVLRASLASPSLLRSIRFGPGSDPNGVVKGGRSKAHRVWVTQADTLGAPLEALTHLLAHSITEQFQEPTAVVTFAGARLSVQWRQPGRKVAAPVSKSIADILHLADPPFCHLFFVAPDGRDPKPILGKLYGRFHRIVYLAETLPQEMPSQFFGLLYPAVRRRVENFSHPSNGDAHITWKPEDEGPYFSSFVTSLTRKPTHETFATEPVDKEFASRTDDPEPPANRIERDHCRIWFDLKSIQELWDSAPDDNGKVDLFVGQLLKDAEIKETAFRWARAVTNRSVGVALSGGGAASYALVPLFRQLHELKVPIDVLSGVSGGAFLGAYYCKEGVDGLDRCINDGWLYQLGLLPDAVISEVGRWIVDNSMGSALVGETTVRFVPVTIKLRGNQPPSAQRIKSGTLGEAVQASGAAPLLFGPVSKRTSGEWARYSDGGMAMLIPARILRNYGADLLFAFNCLSGPAQSNPLVDLPGGRLLYSFTPIGGLIDLWMSAAYMQERLSRAVNPDVAVYFEAPPEKAPSLKSFFFASARDIAQASALDDAVKTAATDCSNAWKKFVKNEELPVLAQLAGSKFRK